MDEMALAAAATLVMVTAAGGTWKKTPARRPSSAPSQLVGGLTGGFTGTSSGSGSSSGSGTSSSQAQSTQSKIVRISSQDVSALSSNKYVYFRSSTAPLTSVELFQLSANVRRTLTKTGDHVSVNGITIALSSQRCIGDLLDHLSDLIATEVAGFRLMGNDADGTWKAFATEPFELSFSGQVADVMGTAFASSHQHGRHVTGPHRYDDSLTRVLTVSLDELGAANGLLASAIVDSEDVSFDGRTDIREFLRPKESQTLTFNLRLNRVDGTESLDDILQWTMVLRLRYGSPTSSAATRRSGQSEDVANPYTMGRGGTTVVRAAYM